MARAGVGSRRASEELIRAGRVTVDGRVATLGDKVDPARARVEVDGARVPLDPHLRYFALNKPSGVVVTMRDPRGREDLAAFLPDVPGIVAVGRLDLLTNDGRLANRLMHPRYGVEREYLAEVDGAPLARHVVALRRGVELEDGPARAVAARIEGRAGARGALRLVMTEGRKREVRRVLAAVGLPVRRLVRVRVGPVRLGRLAPGKLRELSPTEVGALFAAADSGSRKGAGNEPIDLGSRVRGPSKKRR